MVTETQIEEWLSLGEALVQPKYQTQLNDKANKIAYGEMLRDVYFHADRLDYHELIKHISNLKKRARSLSAGEAKTKINTFVVISESMFESPTAHLELVKKMKSENRLPIDTTEAPKPANPPKPIQQPRQQNTPNRPPQPQSTPVRPTQPTQPQNSPRRPIETPTHLNPENSEMFEQLVSANEQNREEIIAQVIQKVKRKKKTRNIVFTLILFLLIGGIGYGIYYWQHDSAPVQTVKVPTEQTEPYICTAKSLNVRNEAHANGYIIGKVQKGDTVYVISTGHAGFAKIRYNDQIGYVSERYITKQ